MKFDQLITKCKDNSKIYCIYLLLKSLNNKELCENIIGIKKNPYSVMINRYGNMEPDKWIYVIYFNTEYQRSGFCSLYKFVLAHLAYAKDLGLTPVVYWGNKTLYYDSTIQSTTNCFEYYFKPVSEISYSQVEKCKKVIVSKSIDRSVFCKQSIYTNISEEDVIFLSQFIKPYIQIKDEVKALFWNELKEITDGGRTLGVHVRATDFYRGFNRHPVAISSEEYLQTAKIMFDNGDFDRLFLATDDMSVISLFKKTFGNKLFFYEETFRSSDGKAIHYGNNCIKRVHHKYLLGLEILRDFYTLGYCAGLVSGVSNVSTCARIIAASRGMGYKKLCVLNKGINHNFKDTKFLMR